MRAKSNLLIYGSLVAVGLLALSANASALPPGSVSIANDTLISLVRGGPACCRTTLRCVRKIGERCTEWRYVTQSICPGARC